MGFGGMGAMRGGFPGMRGGLGSGSTMDYVGGFGGFDGGFGGGRGVVSSYATKTGRKPIGPYMPTGVVNEGAPPDEDKIAALLERTKYRLKRMQGERTYRAPDFQDGEMAGKDCEVFIGNLPMDMYEDALIPVLEAFGTLRETRLKMDPASGLGRGFCFVVYGDAEEAKTCVKALKNYEIAPHHRLKVNIQLQNCRLYVGNIPKKMNKDQLISEFSKFVSGVVDCVVYNTPEFANRGFCFLDFDTHKAASDAKRQLPEFPLFGQQKQVGTAWAEKQEEPGEDVMSQVKVLMVRNLTDDVDENVLGQVKVVMIRNL